MARAAPFALRSRPLAILLVAALAGCARPSAELPPDYGSVNATAAPSLDGISDQDKALTCEQVADEAKAVAQKSKELESAIHAERGRNQAVGYFAGVGAPLLLPLGLAMEPNVEEKRMLDDNQIRMDQLILLRRVKNCPS